VGRRAAGNPGKAFHSTGFFRKQAKNVRALMARLDAEFGGALPNDSTCWFRCPASAARPPICWWPPCSQARPRRGHAFHPACDRLGFVRNETDATKIEFALREIVPEREWTNWSHALVWHGRRRCFARKPDCAHCPLADLCPAAEKAGAK
jgi:endonuclease-3